MIGAKKVIETLSVLLIVTLVGTYGYQYYRSRADGKNKNVKNEQEDRIRENANSDAARNDEAPLPVRVVKIKRGSLPLRLSVSAIAEVRQKAVIKSEVQGKIIKINFEPGEKVQKGDTLVLLDSTNEKISLEQAKAERLKALSKYIADSMNYKFKLSKKNDDLVSNKKKAYEEMLKKYKKGEISVRELHIAEDDLLNVLIKTGAIRNRVRKVINGLTQAEINVEKARIELERTIIKAPFPGTISDLMVSEGEMVSAGTDLIKIVNLDSLYLKASVLETEASKIKIGMGVRLKFASFPRKLFYGQVKAISPELSEKEETLPVYINIKNPGILRAGMRAEAEIEYKVLRNIIKVPRKAILVRSERPLVFVVENNIALWRYVQMGEQNNEEVEIKGGVNAGELVVVEGQLTLAHQSKVKIIK